MLSIQTIFVYFLKCALQNVQPDKYIHLSNQEKTEIIEYAKKQGLTSFMQRINIFMSKPTQDILFSQLLQDVYVDTRQLSESNSLIEELEKNKIYCMPLKGIITKFYYPNTELRTMGDLDFLYKKEQTSGLKKVMENLGYCHEGDATKHDHYRKNDILVEMHKSLVSTENRYYQYFSNSWKRATPITGKKYIFQMKLEDHYIFSLCHLLDHFLRGGVGIRMVLDLYILQKNATIDFEYINSELSTLELNNFNSNIIHLSKVWFEDEEKTKIDEDLEKYILNGGVFGKEDNMIVNSKIQYSSGIKYILKAVFPNYRTMKSIFPWLNNPLLVPYAWIRRIFIVLSTRKKNVNIQFQRAFKIKKKNSSDVKRQKDFLKEVGITWFD